MEDLDEEDRAAVERDRELAKLQLLADLQAVMATHAGPRVITWIIESLCGISRNAHCGERTHDTAFNNGRQAVGQDLLERVAQATPDHVHRIRESFVRRLTADESE